MDIFLDMVSIFGQMEATSKVNTKMDYAMAMESGRNSQAIVINMRENIEMIKKTDMVYSHGETATHIKVTIRMIWGMDMEKFVGMMEVSIEGNGQRVFNMVKDSYMCQAKG